MLGNALSLFTDIMRNENEMESLLLSAHGLPISADYFGLSKI